MKNFLVLIVCVFLNGCSIENINYTVPIVITYEPENILSTSASIGGRILGEGGKDVTEYGVVWSKNPGPTINDHKVILGSRLGDFFDTQSGFEPGTTYFLRAYGINSIGAGYGDSYEFKTSNEAPCNPTQNNFLNITGWNDLSISDVVFSETSRIDSSTNVNFQTSTYMSSTKILVEFNEINGRFPLSGEYTVVNGGFETNNQSTGKARLMLIDYGWVTTEAVAQPGTKFYVKNENGIITFIFCNTPLRQIILNGKFSRSNQR